SNNRRHTASRVLRCPINGNAKWVIGVLGSIAALSIGGIVITEVSGREPHTVLGYTVVACIAAISSILVPPGESAIRHPRHLCEGLPSFLGGQARRAVLPWPLRLPHLFDH